MAHNLFQLQHQLTASKRARVGMGDAMEVRILILRKEVGRRREVGGRQLEGKMDGDK